MCSNYEFPSKKKLSFLDLHENQLELDFKQHVYPLYDAPIIMNGPDQFELYVGAYSCINVPPILVRTVPAIPVPNVPLAIFKEYWD